ncbi:MAG: hypothetical protein BWY31_04426 [Lentisphaerae bacterium ADurb.Bin242]|nr:MAG: hypothetical protein BWY31_04426 [Lentisphaerae bacterium ADurb.Bin242]
MSKINDIASAIADILKDYGAKVVSVPKYELEDTLQMQVSVCAVSMKAEMLSKRTDEEIYVFEVGVMKHISSESEFKEMLDKLETIRLLFKHRELDNMGTFCFKIENDPAYVHEHIATLSQFTGILTLYFKAFQ